MPDGSLATFVAARATAIVELFVARVPKTYREGLTRSELVDHLPDVLAEVAAGIQAGRWPPTAIFEHSATGAVHGRQRLRVGFDLDAVVREYGLVSDCIHERLEAEEIVPTVRELRLLGDCLAGALADSVAEYTQGQTAQQQEQAERYRTLFESIDDGFCLMQMIVDEHGKTVDYRFLDANAAFEGHTGLVGAVGKRARELVPDLDASWFELYGKVAETGETARFENHAPAMNDRWFDVYASRVGKPEARQVALVFKDISARKRAEQEAARLLELESAARSEAEAASRLKDEFLATVSHELRTPLNSMLGWVQMLRSGTIAEDKRDRALETIERNARAQAQLIEDLLDVSSVLAGKLRLALQALDPASIVAGALDTVRPAADAKGLRIQAALASGATVMADPARLQQIAWNLLSNAVKFTARGGRIQVTLERLDSAVELVVTDTGIGIAKEFQPFVFDRFRQAEAGTTRTQGGLGLGLAIVRQLVELHGGTVGIQSAGPGQGSTFSVRLPIAALRSNAEPEPLRDPMAARGLECPPELADLRVLLVDDEPDARDMVRTLLEGCGARVRTASSAAEALELLVAEPPDVLLSDIGMPEEDGYSLIAKVRQLPVARGGGVPAVALTAYARSEDRTRALLSGFSSHVPKPVEPLELLAVIASLTVRRR